MKAEDSLTDHFQISAKRKRALEHLEIKTVDDLFYRLPARYEDVSEVWSIASLDLGVEAVVYGYLSKIARRRLWKNRRSVTDGYLTDDTAKIKLIWFNQPYLSKLYRDGMRVKVTGRVTGKVGKQYIANPEVEILGNWVTPEQKHPEGVTTSDGSLYPVYRETEGVTSRWFYHTICKCFAAGVLDNLADPIPPAILTRYKLPNLKTALVWAHTPKKTDHAKSAHKRFAFEEVFYIQLLKALERKVVDKTATHNLKTNPKLIEDFVGRFPFTLTDTQNRAIADILADFNRGAAMSRLLEGDVGSGKTAVAATTVYAVVSATSQVSKNKTELAPQTSGEVQIGDQQVAYMAPTEILAKQHFHTFVDYFRHLPIQIGLLIGSECMKFDGEVSDAKPIKMTKKQLSSEIKNGNISIVIGTHVLIYKSVEFNSLTQVIIDEQHRFGTRQRMALTKKNKLLPHLLSMTATPIPRTLALTIYGDLDITRLKGLPQGRKPVITKIISPSKEEKMYAHIRLELATGRQAYVICPRIDEPDMEKETALNLKNVTTECARLKQDVFPEYRLAVLHSKMKPAEKDRVMRQFDEHKIDILVATSVVQVGVNVPNATNIIIEGGERFGLAQLHQLRGRVMRSHHQPYCFVITESRSEQTRARLKALTTTKDGFELAEYDLKFRGSGELYGERQSGLIDLKMAALKNLKLVTAARQEAKQLVEKTGNLVNSYPLIAEKVTRLSRLLHLE